MRLNIYVPDDLGGQLKLFRGLNVSAVCQAALADEMTRQRPERDRIAAWASAWGNAYAADTNEASGE